MAQFVHIHQVVQQTTGLEGIARSKRVEVAHQHVRFSLFLRHDTQNLAHFRSPDAFATPGAICE